MSPRRPRHPGCARCDADLGHGYNRHRIWVGRRAGSEELGIPLMFERFLMSGAGLLASLCLIFAVPAAAQDTAGASAQAVQQLSAEELRAFMAELDDVRAFVSAELDRLGTSPGGDGAANGRGFIGAVQGDSVKIRDRLAQVFEAPKNGPQVIAQTYQEMMPGSEGFGSFLLFIFALATLVIAGLVVEWLYRRITQEVRLRIDQTPECSLGIRLLNLLLRAVLDILAIAAFVLGVFIAFTLWQGNDVAREFVATYVMVIVGVRSVSIVSRFVFSPRAPGLRCVPATDAEARAYHRWALWLAGVWAFAFFTIHFLELRGISPESIILQRGLAGFIIAAMLVAIVWWRRRVVADAIRGGVDAEAAKTAPDAVTRLRAHVADLWHLLATLYIALVWLLTFVAGLADRPSQAKGAVLSLIVVIAFPLIDIGVGKLMRRLFLRKNDEGALVLSATDEQSAVGIQRAIRILLAVIAIGAFISAWGFNVTGAAMTNPVGSVLARPLFNIALILIVAYVAWEALKSAIDRRLSKEGGDPTERAEGESEAEEGGGDPGTRLQTLLPLLRKFALSVLAVIVVLSVLSSFGVNIAPLLAGAGVVGIAVGFGAQALVRDIFSGFFFLIDDAFRVGEYIEIDSGLMGTVEAISIRSMKLRHHRGALHILPFGELRSITNRTRGWVIEKLDLRLPYDTDVEQVRKIIKRIGIEMMEDPDLGPRMIDPLKSQGVYKLEDSAMILRAKFTAKPRGRAKVRREAQVRIKRAFDAAGIQFAHRQVTVHVPESEAGGAAAGAAAAAAIQAQEEQEAAAAGAKA